MELKRVASLSVFEGRPASERAVKEVCSCKVSSSFFVSRTMTVTDLQCSQVLGQNAAHMTCLQSSEECTQLTARQVGECVELSNGFH